MKKLSIFITICLSGMNLAALEEGIQNGTFNTNLDGWAISPEDTDAAVWFNGAAVLSNPGDFPLYSEWPFAGNSFLFLSSYQNSSGNEIPVNSLSQEFIIPANADKLSFNIAMEVYNRHYYGSGGETDTLTVTLLYGQNPTQEVVLLNITSTELMQIATPGNSQVYEFFDDDEVKISTLHIINGTTVEYNISPPPAGQNAKIEFLLSHDTEDDDRTAVFIDDVVITTAGDSTPPTIVTGGLTELWPPNHKFHTFNLSDLVQSVTDDTDGEIDIDENCVILSIYSDEPEDVKGNGDGKTKDDIVILGPSRFMVRSERQGTGNGRVYGITFMVSDSTGNIATGTVYLGVPHDKSGKRPIIDDGSDEGYIIEVSFD